MKNTFQINIGLNTSNNNPAAIHRLLQDLRAAGFYAVGSRITLGYWHGQPECTLAAECLFAIPLCHPEARLAIRVSLARIAEQHEQTCVAVLWPDSTGELVPNVGEFDPNQFRPVYPAESLKETPASYPSKKESFIAYVKKTLLPNLEMSGDKATAANFRTCLRFMDEPAPACDCVTSVVDALKHRSQVLQDNEKLREAIECDCVGAYLTVCADDLRAVIYPTPDRRFFECITHDLGNIRDHAEEIGNAQACIIKEIDSLLEIIRPLAIPARNPEITSGW